MSRAGLLVAMLSAWPLVSVAQRHPTWQRPFDGDRSLTNGFDLDRNTGLRLDWRGWRDGDDGHHAPHPLDQHAGADFAMPNGSAVRAVEAGTVTAVSDGVPWDDDGAANWVEVHHGAGRSSVYWHLGPGIRSRVSPGVAVEAGTELGPSDNTGDSTGPHLHLGEFEDGVAVDAFQRGRFIEPLLAGQVRCVVSESAAVLRRDPNLDAPPVGELLPGACVFTTEERVGFARVHVARGDRLLAARDPDGCGMSGVSLQGTWKPSAVQSVATLAHAAGSFFSESVDAPLSAAFDLVSGSPFFAEVAVTFSGPVNARVGWTLTTADAVATGTFDALGRPPGTPRAPIDVSSGSFVDRGTTLGGPVVHARSSCASPPPFAGPERWYRARLATPARLDVRVSVGQAASTGLFLLAAADGNRCLASAQNRLVSDALPVGTYWVVVEASDARNPALGVPYTLQVQSPGVAPGLEYTSDRWLSLGTHRLATNPRLTLSWDGSTVIDGRPFRAAVEAVRIRPVERYSHAFVELSALGPPRERPDLVVLSARDATPLYLTASSDALVAAHAPLGAYLPAGPRASGFVEVQVPGFPRPLHVPARDVTVFDGVDFAVPRECPPDEEDPQANTFDRDGDGVLDARDSCPDAADPGQEDRDGDRVGDACDACPDDALDDRDGDGTCDGRDACPLVPDDGADADADGLPDACDPCPDDPLDDEDGDDVCGPVPVDPSPCGCGPGTGMGVALLAMLARRRRRDG